MSYQHGYECKHCGEVPTKAELHGGSYMSSMCVEERRIRIEKQRTQLEKDQNHGEETKQK